MVEGLDPRTFEEAEQQGAAGAEAACELSEDRGNTRRLSVDDRVPAQDSAEGAVFHGQRCEVANAEEEGWKSGGCALDKFRHEVEPLCLDTMVAEKGRPVAGPTPSVKSTTRYRCGPIGNDPTVFGGHRLDGSKVLGVLIRS